MMKLVRMMIMEDRLGMRLNHFVFGFDSLISWLDSLISWLDSLIRQLHDSSILWHWFVYRYNFVLWLNQFVFWDLVMGHHVGAVVLCRRLYHLVRRLVLYWFLVDNSGPFNDIVARYRLVLLNVVVVAGRNNQLVVALAGIGKYQYSPGGVRVGVRVTLRFRIALRVGIGVSIGQNRLG